VSRDKKRLFLQVRQVTISDSGICWSSIFWICCVWKTNIMMLFCNLIIERLSHMISRWLGELSWSSGEMWSSDEESSRTPGHGQSLQPSPVCSNDFTPSMAEQPKYHFCWFANIIRALKRQATFWSLCCYYYFFTYSRLFFFFLIILDGAQKVEIIIVNFCSPVTLKTLWIVVYKCCGYVTFFFRVRDINVLDVIRVLNKWDVYFKLHPCVGCRKVWMSFLSVLC